MSRIFIGLLALGLGLAGCAEVAGTTVGVAGAVATTAVKTTGAVVGATAHVAEKAVAGGPKKPPAAAPAQPAPAPAQPEP